MKTLFICVPALRISPRVHPFLCARPVPAKPTFKCVNSGRHFASPPTAQQYSTTADGAQREEPNPPKIPAEEQQSGLPARTYKIIHFTDVHFFRPSSLRPSQLLNKSVVGVLNGVLNKKKRAFKPDQLLPVFIEQVLEKKPDLCIFSGDLTTVASEPEFDAARTVLDPLLTSGLPVAMVPGNHDRYTAEAQGRMESRFGEWMGGGTWRNGRWEGASVDSPWPRRFQLDRLVVYGIDPCVPVILSGGYHHPGEIERLGKCLAESQALANPAVVVGHFPIRGLDGAAYDKIGHSLTDRDELEAVIRTYPPVAYLSGHEHRWFINAFDCATKVDSFDDASVEASPERSAGRSSEASGHRHPTYMLGCGSTTFDGEDLAKQAGFFEFDVVSSELRGNFAANFGRYQWDGQRYLLLHVAVPLSVPS